MENIMKPEPHKIVSVIRQTAAEFTIRVACDKDPGYGQFFQLSLPKIGEAPISVCGKGPGYVEFTIRKVGRRRYTVYAWTVWKCISGGSV